MTLKLLVAKSQFHKSVNNLKESKHVAFNIKTKSAELKEKLEYEKLFSVRQAVRRDAKALCECSDFSHSRFSGVRSYA